MAAGALGHSTECWLLCGGTFLIFLLPHQPFSLPPSLAPLYAASECWIPWAVSPGPSSFLSYLDDLTISAVIGAFKLKESYILSSVLVFFMATKPVYATFYLSTSLSLRAPRPTPHSICSCLSIPHFSKLALRPTQRLVTETRIVLTVIFNYSNPVPWQVLSGLFMPPTFLPWTTTVAPNWLPGSTLAIPNPFFTQC